VGVFRARIFLLTRAALFQMPLAETLWGASHAGARRDGPCPVATVAPVQALEKALAVDRVSGSFAHMPSRPAWARWRLSHAVTLQPECEPPTQRVPRQKYYSLAGVRPVRDATPVRRALARPWWSEDPGAPYS